MSRFLLFFFAVLLSACTSSGPARVGHRADYITLDKSDRLLTVWENGKPYKTYQVWSLGWNPWGHKMQEGDGRTPEGHYYINEKHVSSRFQKFLNISYPNDADKADAFARGVPPGGAVGIHGDKGGAEGAIDRKNPAWTNGCVAIRNEAIEELYEIVPVGTEIFIQP